MCLGLPALRVSGAWTAPPGRRDFPAQPEPPGHRGPRARPDRQARRDFPAQPEPPGHRGPQGTPGATGPTGPAGGPGEDVFASYYSDVRSVPNNGQIPLYELLNDPTGNITLSGTQQLRLQPGYYQVFFDVFVILASPGYLQITPSFNGQARIDLGIYFRTAGSDSTAGGARALSFYAPAPTTFSLTYSSSVDGRNVQTGLVIQKMNRASG